MGNPLTQPTKSCHTCLASIARSCSVSEALVPVHVATKERPCPLHEAEHISRQPLNCWLGRSSCTSSCSCSPKQFCELLHLVDGIVTH